MWIKRFDISLEQCKRFCRILDKIQTGCPFFIKRKFRKGTLWKT